MQGHRVLILEKETFPRYQIGESLLPSTIRGVCRLSGVADELANAGFTYKKGGTFRWGASPEPWTFSFSLSPKIAGATSFAYQVERAKFDNIPGSPGAHRLRVPASPGLASRSTPSTPTSTRSTCTAGRTSDSTGCAKARSTAPPPHQQPRAAVPARRLPAAPGRAR